MGKILRKTLASVAGSVTALLLMANTAQAADGPTAYHGSDWAVGVRYDDFLFPDIFHGVQVKDVEDDGNYVFAQVWYYDNRSASERMTTAYDYTLNSTPTSQGLPGVPVKYRVCEENGSCGGYKSWPR
ncbi:hypothetical protein GCM10022224_072350 [Nonomuraea antimicrobica]|uniref:Secreted protein n=1 Tax=Nonomuraea antimicrobica TaxID=561173 RepID=A0ABP7CXJ5_9ACTN